MAVEKDDGLLECVLPVCKTENLNIFKNRFFLNAKENLAGKVYLRRLLMFYYQKWHTKLSFVRQYLPISDWENNKFEDQLIRSPFHLTSTKNLT